MAEKTITEWRGLGLLHPDCLTEDSLWTDESSFTEANPTAGEVVPQQTGPLQFRGYGSQSSGGTVTMRVQTPGFGGPTNRLSIIRKDNDSVLWGGHNPPATVQGTSAPSWTDGTGVGVQKALYPVSAAGADGKVVSVYYEQISSPASHKIVSRTLDPSTNLWGSAVDVHTYPSGSVLYDPIASIHIMPDGSFVATCVIYDADRSTANFRVYKSADSGTTWAEVSSYALDEPLDASAATSGGSFQDPRRIRTAYSNGLVVCLLEVELTNTAVSKGNQTLTFCSNDNGLTYTPVVTATDLITLGTAVHRTRADIIPTASGFAMSIVEGITGTDILRVRELAHGYQKYTGSTYIDVITSAFDIIAESSGTVDYVNDGDCAFMVDDAGVYWLYCTALTLTGDPTLVYRSRDDLETFEGVGEGDRLTSGAGAAGQLFDCTSATDRPNNYHAVYSYGRGIMASNCLSSDSVENSFFAHMLGGWSSVVQPALDQSALDTKRGMWTRTGLPISLPDSTGVWALTQTTGTSTLVDDPSVRIVTLSSGTRFYANNPQGATAEGYIGHYTVKVDSGGSVSADDVAVQFLISGGTTTEYDCSLRFTTTQVALVDNVGPTTIATVSVPLSTAFYTFRFALKEGEVKAWYRPAGLADDQEWVDVGSSTSIASRTLGGGGTNVIRWGTISASINASEWQEWHHVSDSATGDQITTQTNPDDLSGKSLGGPNHPVYTIDGLYVTPVSGPGSKGDEFIAYAGASHPWWRMLPMVSASPREPYRSASVTSGAVPAQSFAFRLMSSSTSSNPESLWPTDIMVVDLRKFNGYGVLVERYNSGAWATLADVNVIAATGTLERYGKTARFNSTSSTNRYIGADTMKGATVKLSVAPILRKVTGNESGMNQSVGDTKNAVYQLDGVETGDPTSYASAQLWAPNICIVIPLLDKKMEGVRVTLKSTQTADDYLECGAMGIYYGLPLKQYSNSWSWIVEPNTEINEQTSGARRGVELGPPRRVFEGAWIDPVNTTPIHGDGATPDYWLASGNSGAIPVAIPAETTYRVADAVGQTQGGAQTSLLFPRVDYVANGGTDVQTYVFPYETQYGRMTNSVRMEHVAGREGNTTSDDYIGEVYRVARIVHEEEV